MSKRQVRTPRYGSLLRIIILPGQNKLPGMDFDIGEREFSSIGFATVHWAFLEFALHRRTVKMATRAKCAVPIDASNFSFTRRLRAFREVVNQTVKQPKTKKKWLDISDNISRVEGLRHKVTHSLWSYNARNPEKLWAHDRRSEKSKSEPFDPDKINELGASIGVLSFALMFPRGPSDVPRPSSYMSRSFQLMIQGKGRLNPDLDPPISREGTPLQFSSKDLLPPNNHADTVEAVVFPVDFRRLK